MNWTGSLPMSATPLAPAALPVPGKKKSRREGGPCAADLHADYLARLGERVRAAGAA
jgi:hypothetical protein